MIDVVNFSDLGYRLIQPRVEFDAHVVDKLALYARTRAGYEVESSHDGRWIRHRERRAGAVTPLIRELVYTDADTPDLRSALQALESRGREWEELDGQYRTSVQDAIALCRPQADEPPHRLMHFLTCAASLVPPGALVTTLAGHIVPAFLARYRRGAFLAYEIDYQLETRLGLCRSLHRFSQYPVAAVTAEDQSPLQALHAQSSFETPGIFVDLLSALTYPYVSVVSAVRAGLLFVFVLDPAPEHVEGFFPISWGAKVRSGSDFARARLDLREVLAGLEPQARKRASLRRHVLAQTPSREQTLSLLRYSLRCFGETLWHSTDPAEHCPPNSSEISPLVPFEFGLTFDRVLRKGVLAVVGASEIDRKDDCFEIADLLGELWCQRNDVDGAADVFKRLFERTAALELLEHCVAGAPLEEWTPIFPGVRAAYDRLVESIRASVVLKSKLTTDGVLVRNRKLNEEVVEPSEAFASNVARALRNAHHGYLTAQDSGNRPARYLSLVTGHLTEDVSLLGAFWAWALATAPDRLLGRAWLRVGGYVA